MSFPLTKVILEKIELLKNNLGKFYLTQGLV